jgi:membrane protease YdiL (CAAX protease family)
MTDVSSVDEIKSVDYLSLPTNLPQPIFRRMRHLALVLWVALSIPIISSSYYLTADTTVKPLPHAPQTYRLVIGLATELTGLVVLAYVMAVQGKSWADIGWSVSWRDLYRAFGVGLLAVAAGYILVLPIQIAALVYAGHYLHPKSVASMLGLGLSFLSLVFILVNPFFEEMIVRAYTMSEIMSLGGSRTLAVVISVALQVSYHLYQGWLNVLAVTATFLVFSLYFAKTRRIFPIVLVHSVYDLIALLRMR